MRRTSAILTLAILQGCQFPDGAAFDAPAETDGADPGDRTPDEEEEPAETPSPTAPEPPECGALLAAQRTYLPDSEWIDGTSTYESRRRFTVPETLVVTEGNGGNHCAILELAGYWTLSCHYVGGSDQPAPLPANSAQWSAGLTYHLVACTWAGASDTCAPTHLAEIEAGESVRADRLSLHVAGGAFRGDAPEVYNPTLVHAVVEGRCWDEDDGEHDGEGRD